MRAETSNHQCGHGDGDAVAKYRFTKDRRRFYRTPSTNTWKNRTEPNKTKKTSHHVLQNHLDAVQHLLLMWPKWFRWNDGHIVVDDVVVAGGGAVEGVVVVSAARIPQLDSVAKFRLRGRLDELRPLRDWLRLSNLVENDGYD